ncbi:MAG: PepSY domain-containing protein [Marinicella sp.]
MRPQLFFRKTHKWIGLILVIQFILWFFSGFLMSWMPIEEIHGDHLLNDIPTRTIDPDYLDLSGIAKKIKEPVLSARIKPWLEQQVLELKTNNQTQIYTLPDFKLLSPLNEQQVRSVIKFHIIPDYEINQINLLDEVPTEARGRKAPLWQVQLDGPENPRIYISTSTGEIVAKRTDRWRLFDFLWMLHIMDYDERENFNHPLLYITAFSALIFTLTGLVLLFYGFKRPRFSRQ